MRTVLGDVYLTILVVDPCNAESKTEKGMVSWWRFLFPLRCGFEFVFKPVFSDQATMWTEREDGKEGRKMEVQNK